VVELQQTAIVLVKGIMQARLLHAFASMHCAAVSKASSQRVRDVPEAEGSPLLAAMHESWAAVELHLVD